MDVQAISNTGADKLFGGNRKVSTRNRKGDVVGSNFTIPEGDFARFLGYKPATDGEKAGDKPASADRVLELALQKDFNELGKGAMQRGSAYRNMYVSHGRYANQPGRERDSINDGIDAIKSSVELNKASNMYYLEMQYKFQLAGKSFGVISNLMKVRHESTKKSINEVR